MKATLIKSAKKLYKNIKMLFAAMKHKDTPLLAKALAAFTLAYALSPIDLIPDFIPVIGHLDDIVLVPIGIFLVFSMIPEKVKKDIEKKAKQISFEPKGSKLGAFIIVSVWLLVLMLGVSMFL